jgi:succinate dehydrogenase hydrophobic anchor subunit
MKTIRIAPSNHESALLWFIKILAGGLILVFLVIHFIANHLVAPGGLFTYSDVVAYYQNPAVLIMEGCFLTFVVIHALLGVRSVLLDLNPSPIFVRIINIGLIGLGIVTIIYGIWLLVTVSALGRLP